MGDRKFEIEIVMPADLSGSQQAAGELRKVGDEATAAGSKLRVAAEGATTKTADLKKMIQAVGHEFPLLGAAGRMAMNPLVGGVSALVGLFSLMRSSFEEAMQAMNTGMGGGTVSDAVRALGNVTGEAALKFAEFKRSLEGIAGAQRSVHDRTQEAISAIKAQAAQGKELAEAQKGAELARVGMLESQGKMTGPQAAAARFGIEERYARLGRLGAVEAKEAELGAKRGELEQVSRNAGLAVEDAARLDAEATAAEVAEKRRAAIVEATRKDLGNAEAQIKALRGQTILWQDVAVGLEGTARAAAGIPGERPVSAHAQQLRAAEGLRDASAARLGVLGTPEAEFESQNRARMLRERATGAQERAKALLSRGVELSQTLPGEVAAANRSYVAAGESGTHQSLGRAYTAAGAAAGTAHQLAAQITAAVESGKSVGEASLRKVSELAASQADLARRISAIETQTKNSRNP